GNEAATVSVVDPRIRQEAIAQDSIPCESDHDDREGRMIRDVLTFSVAGARNTKVNGCEAAVASNLCRLPQEVGGRRGRTLIDLNVIVLSSSHGETSIGGMNRNTGIELRNVQILIEI